MKMKFFAALAFSALVGLSFTACGGDDNGGDKPGPGPDGGKTDPSTIAASALVAHFGFEGNGNDSKGGLTPSQTEKASYPAGQRGKAFQGTGAKGTGMDGNADEPSYLIYNITGTKLADLKAFTIAMWLKHGPTTDGGPEDMIFQVNGTSDALWGNLWLLHSRTAGGDSKWGPNYNNGFFKEDAADWNCQRVGDIKNPVDEANNVKATIFQFNQWQHVIMCYDNATSTWNIYVNGSHVLLGNNQDGDGYTNRKQGADGPAFGDLKFASATTLTIGAWAEIAAGNKDDAWAGCYKGMLDEFRIYDRALTTAEAKALYDAEVDYLD